MVRNKLSQLGAFLLLTALLSAWVGPSRPGTGGTAPSPTPTPSPGRTTPSPTPTPSPGVWTPIGPKGRRILALAIDPQRPTTLYAGTDGGVYKSTDGGANWQAINTGLTNLGVNALAIDPRTPTTLYAGTAGGGVFRLVQAPGTTPMPSSR